MIRCSTRLRCLTALLIGSFLTPSASISAQRIPPFEVGEVLRITAPASGIEEQIARYLRLYQDTLTLQADEEMRVPVAHVTRLDVSRGISHRSTLVGVAAGAFAGLLFGIAVASDDDTELSGGGTAAHAAPSILNSGGSGGMGTLSGAAVAPIAAAFIGGLVGGMVGKALREHRWEEVPLDRIRVDVAPDRLGVALRLLPLR